VARRRQKVRVPARSTAEEQLEAAIYVARAAGLPLPSGEAPTGGWTATDYEGLTAAELLGMAEKRPGDSACRQILKHLDLAEEKG